jgi:hypothetical protein
MGWKTGGRDFYFVQSVHTSSATHPASYKMYTLGAIFPRIKAAVHKAYHSLPSSAELKNGGAIPLLHHMPS